MEEPLTEEAYQCADLSTYEDVTVSPEEVFVLINKLDVNKANGIHFHAESSQ